MQVQDVDISPSFEKMNIAGRENECKKYQVVFRHVRWAEEHNPALFVSFLQVQLGKQAFLSRTIKV